MIRITEVFHFNQNIMFKRVKLYLKVHFADKITFNRHFEFMFLPYADSLVMINIDYKQQSPTV